MWRETGIAVSLPALEAQTLPRRGSVMGPDELALEALPDDLKRAIQLVRQACAAARAPVVYLPRPEMFTSGASLDWLRRALGPIRDHLAISDGTAVRVVPALRNHVFFHGLHRKADSEALAALARRAPELLSQLSSQVNTALKFPAAGRSAAPPSLALAPAAEALAADAECLPFFCGSDTIEASAAEIGAMGPVVLLPPDGGRVICVTVTETALLDESFIAIAAEIVARAFFDPQTRIVLQLPAGPVTEVGAHIEATLRALLGADALIPRAVSERIVFATGNLSPSAFGGAAELLAHDSFDFWRWPRAYYASFRHVSVWTRRGRSDAAALRATLSVLCGRSPVLRTAPLRSARAAIAKAAKCY